MVLSSDSRVTKRRKTEYVPTTTNPDIKGAFELHDLLRFKQSSGPEIRTNIEKFRAFLISIEKNEDVDEKQIQLKVLKQYCDDQSSSNKDEVDFRDLLSTWSFAAQSDLESVLSAVPAALAQFFRTISSELDFREFGLSLCHSLFKHDQTRLLERGLSAPKSKEFLISPCIRLLTEITSFDGGVVVSNVFLRRDSLLKRLDILLDPPQQARESTDRRRPTVRRNAQRLLLALLKYLDVESKIELITQGRAFHACLRHLTSDGGDIVRDILASIRKQLLAADIPKHSKTGLLNPANLGLLIPLYDFETEAIDVEDESKQIRTVREDVHDFLGSVCTSEQGILTLQSGWYPVGFNPNSAHDVDADMIDLGLDSPYYFDGYHSRIPVKNTNLSTFLQKLVIQEDALQADLVTTIFKAAPELVADYFSKKLKLVAQPGDSIEWRNQFAFLFNTVQLPVPPFCGWENKLPFTPPPTSIVVESILPRPLDRSTLNQCLRSNEDLIVMSAARLITVAIRKLEEVIQLFESSTTHASLWRQARERLIELTAARCPLYTELVSSLQRQPKDAVQTRTMLLECMAMYCQSLPMAIGTAKFDASPLLLSTLKRLEDGTNLGEDKVAFSSQVDHLVSITSSSQSTRWWHKPKAEGMSLILAMLRFSVQEHSTVINDVLKSKLSEAGILCVDSKALAALQASLKPTTDEVNTNHTWTFLEAAMMRTMKQPVRYLDKLEETQQQVSDQTPLSLVAVAIAEQWPFFAKDNDLPAINTVANWILRLYACLKAISENSKALSHFRNEMLSQCTGEVKKVFEKAIKDISKGPTPLIRNMGPAETSANGDAKQLITPPATPVVTLSSTFSDLPIHPATLSHVSFLTSPSISCEDSETNDRLRLLFRGLSSPQSEIRLSSLKTIPTVMHNLSQSNFSEATQVHLLLGTLHLTASTYLQSHPEAIVPNIVSELACWLLTILLDPSDKMYSKANHFLLLAPSWNITRILPYWTQKILLEDPESDDPYASSVEFEHMRFLDLLSKSLRAKDDMDLFRKSGIFERLCSLYFSAGCKRNERRKILEVIYRATGVEGGTDTLITRVGIRAWLKIVLTREGKEFRDLVEALERRVDETCDHDYIDAWEKTRPIDRQKKDVKVNGTTED